MERDSGTPRSRDSIGSTGSDFLSRLEAKLSFMEDNMKEEDSSHEREEARPKLVKDNLSTPLRANAAGSRTPFSTPAGNSCQLDDRQDDTSLFSRAMQPTQLSPYRDRTSELESLAQRSAERKKNRRAREQHTPQNGQDYTSAQHAYKLQISGGASPVRTAVDKTPTRKVHQSDVSIDPGSAGQRTSAYEDQATHASEIPLSDTQLAAKSLHVERQKVAREKRYAAKQYQIGSEPPTEGSTGRYWSNVSPSDGPRENEVHQSPRNDVPAELSPESNELHAGNNIFDVNAVVVNHTQNTSHKVSPMETVDFSNGSMPDKQDNHFDEKLTSHDLAADSSATLGVSPASEENGSAEDGSGTSSRRGKKQYHNASSSSSRTSAGSKATINSSTRFDVSETFDISSPHHPEYKTCLFSPNDSHVTLAQRFGNRPVDSDQRVSTSGERVLKSLHGRGLTSKFTNSSPSPVRQAEAAVAVASSSNWARIFNGSGTKQRVARKISEGREVAKRIAPRFVKQREVIKSLSSKHIDAVVCSGTTETARIKSHDLHGTPSPQNLMTPAPSKKGSHSLTPGHKVAMYSVSHHFAKNKLTSLSSSPLYRLRSQRSKVSSKIQDTRHGQFSETKRESPNHKNLSRQNLFRRSQRGDSKAAISAGAAAAKSASELLSEALAVLTQPSRV